MLWVIRWLGGLGALGLVGRGMLVVVLLLLRRGVVGGRCEAVCLMWWRRIRVMIMVCCRSNCTSTNNISIPLTSSVLWRVLRNGDSISANPTDILE